MSGEVMGGDTMPTVLCCLLDFKEYVKDSGTNMPILKKKIYANSFYILLH